MVRRVSLITAVLGLCLFLGSAAAEADPVPLQPRNGIPLVIIRVDESEEAIRAASEADPNHTYGTMDAMNESEDHSVRCVGTAEVIVPEDYRGEYGSVSVPQGELRIDYIRGRENTTWDVYANKKPYKFRLSEAAGSWRPEPYGAARCWIQGRICPGATAASSWDGSAGKTVHRMRTRRYSAT